MAINAFKSNDPYLGERYLEEAKYDWERLGLKSYLSFLEVIQKKFTKEGDDEESLHTKK